MAKETAELFWTGPDPPTLIAYFSDIKDTGLFPFSFFRSFDVVFNALDNLGNFLFLWLMLGNM